jgi:two-component system, NtrC family, response regulator HydG
MAERILIVDDEECIRFTFAHFLRAEGYEVACAANYDQGLERMTTQSVDLVIADIVLGGQTGLQLVRQMRALQLTCPVILITGYPTIETATEASRLGAYDYLLKPVRKDPLVQVTRKTLQRQKTQAQQERHQSHLKAIVGTVESATAQSIRL